MADPWMPNVPQHGRIVSHSVALSTRPTLAQTLRREIEVLRSTIPSEAERTNVYRATNTTERHTFDSQIAGIEKKIQTLERKHERMVLGRQASHRRSVINWSLQQKQEAHDSVCEDWLQRERQAVKQVAARRHEIAEIDHQLRIEHAERMQRAQEKNKTLVAQRTDSFVKTVKNWESSVLQHEQQKSAYSLASTALNSTFGSLRSTMSETNRSVREVNEVHNQENLRREMDEKQQRKREIREMRLQQQQKHQRELTQATPTHVKEAQAARENKYRSLLQQSEDESFRSRFRRFEHLNRYASSLHEHNQRRCNSALQLSSSRKNEQHALILAKNDRLDDKLHSITSHQETLRHQIQNARIENDVYRSYETLSDSVTVTRDEKAHANVQRQIISRTLKRVADLVESRNVSPVEHRPQSNSLYSSLQRLPSDTTSQNESPSRPCSRCEACRPTSAQ